MHGRLLQIMGDIKKNEFENRKRQEKRLRERFIVKSQPHYISTRDQSSQTSQEKNHLQGNGTIPKPHAFYKIKMGKLPKTFKTTNSSKPDPENENDIQKQAQISTTTGRSMDLVEDRVKGLSHDEDIVLERISKMALNILFPKARETPRKGPRNGLIDNGDEGCDCNRHLGPPRRLPNFDEVLLENEKILARLAAQKLTIDTGSINRGRAYTKSDSGLSETIAQGSDDSIKKLPKKMDKMQSQLNDLLNELMLDSRRPGKTKKFHVKHTPFHDYRPSNIYVKHDNGTQTMSDFPPSHPLQPTQSSNPIEQDWIHPDKNEKADVTEESPNPPKIRDWHPRYLDHLEYLATTKPYKFSSVILKEGRTSEKNIGKSERKGSGTERNLEAVTYGNSEFDDCPAPETQNSINESSYELDSEDGLIMGFPFNLPLSSQKVKNVHPEPLKKYSKKLDFERGFSANKERGSSFGDGGHKLTDTESPSISLLTDSSLSLGEIKCPLDILRMEGGSDISIRK